MLLVYRVTLSGEAENGIIENSAEKSVLLIYITITGSLPFLRCCWSLHDHRRDKDSMTPLSVLTCDLDGVLYLPELSAFAVYQLARERAMVR